MSGKRFTEEFKKEAVKQVTERGYSVAEVAARLGTTTHSLYAWLKKYGQSTPREADQADAQAEIARLQELRRIEQARIDWLKQNMMLAMSVRDCSKIHTKRTRLSICRNGGKQPIALDRIGATRSVPSRNRFGDRAAAPRRRAGTD